MRELDTIYTTLLMLCSVNSTVNVSLEDCHMVFGELSCNTCNSVLPYKISSHVRDSLVGRPHPLTLSLRSQLFTQIQ